MINGHIATTSTPLPKFPSNVIKLNFARDPVYQDHLLEARAAYFATVSQQLKEPANAQR